MTTEYLTKRLASVMEEWPPTSTVWHKADGKRGIIVEYAVDCTGAVMIVLDTGVGQNWEKCCPHVECQARA